jgi:hypothetical protein
MDVVITTCKHTFHPLCLGAMVNNLAKFVVFIIWNFILKWWTSWGFQKLDKVLTQIVKKMNIEQTWDDIINVENQRNCNI